MNRKVSASLKILIVISIMFHFMYFANYTWSNTASNSAKELVRMHYSRGIELYKQAEYKMAVREFESALRVDPAHKKAEKYLLAARKKMNKKIAAKLYKAASSYNKQKDYAKALQAYEKVLEVIPDDGYALYKSELLKKSDGPGVV
ncbi:hypothetical protein ACFL2J_03390, partial [Candidatus Omnitrophota bacterium]